MAHSIPHRIGTERAMIVLAAVLAALPTCAVGLRIWARRASEQRLRWSDFWIVTNNAVLVAFWVLYIIITHTGAMDLHSGWYSPLLESEKFICRAKPTLDLLFSFATFFLKLSTLSLLKELFCTNPAVRTAQGILTHLTVVCGTVAVTAPLCLNFPTDRICEPGVEMTEDDASKETVIQLFTYVWTMVLDFAILAVPIWQLYPLKMNFRKKVGVMIAFGLGFGTCIVALVRLLLIFFGGRSNTQLNGFFMLGLEPSVGIVGVSVPLCSPLYQRWRRNMEGVRMHRLHSKGDDSGPRQGSKSSTTTIAVSPQESHV